MSSQVIEMVLLGGLGALCLVGAATVVFAREVMRLVLGLGGFLLGVAGLFAWLGFGFLALAQLFLYVGGVLVLVLFAIMLVHRSAPGQPSLSSRHDVLAAISAAGIAGFAFIMLRPAVDAAEASARVATTDGLAEVLLSSMLPQFEIAGLLLLAALVAVVAVSGGDRE